MSTIIMNMLAMVATMDMQIQRERKVGKAFSGKIPGMEAAVRLDETLAKQCDVVKCRRPQGAP
jgi:hypothetical protein